MNITEYLYSPIAMRRIRDVSMRVKQISSTTLPYSPLLPPLVVIRIVVFSQLAGINGYHYTLRLVSTVPVLTYCPVCNMIHCLLHSLYSITYDLSKLLANRTNTLLQSSVKVLVSYSSLFVIISTLY